MSYNPNNLRYWCATTKDFDTTPLWVILNRHQFQETKTANVGTNGGVATNIFGDDDIENITAFKFSHQNIFEEKVRMRMVVLSTQIGAIHTLYESLL